MNNIITYGENKKYVIRGDSLDAKVEGNLIIIGGAEDKENGKEILNYVCSKIDKEKDKLLIATIATELPKIVGQDYIKVFKSLGVKNIEILDVCDRLDSSKESNIEKVKSASVIFFTGGDQLRITSMLGGTPLGDEIIKQVKNRCYFVGTSAGASVVSDTMIVNGPCDESPRKCTLKMAPGLGILKNIIIDQHFSQRGRFGRLLAGIAENPQVLGIGIDEDTAIQFNEDEVMTVLGNGAVYILDGTGITHTNVSEQNQDKILSIHNVKLHVLISGDKFNLLDKVPFEEERR